MSFYFYTLEWFTTVDLCLFCFFIRLRWWRELHERLEKFFKFPLKELQDQGHYDTNSEIDRYYLYLNSFESHTISSVYANALPKSNKHAHA